MSLYVGKKKVGLTSLHLVDKEKYNASIDNFLGSVDENGVLLEPENLNLVFNGVKSVGNETLSEGFRYNKNVTSVDFPDIESVDTQGLFYCFADCTNLTTAPSFNNLTTVGSGGLAGCFSTCTNLTSLSFPALKSDSFGSSTNQFNNMLSGVTGCTVHFPSNLQSVIGSWSDVTSGFGGTDTTVLFDLPATE